MTSNKHDPNYLIDTHRICRDCLAVWPDGMAAPIDELDDYQWRSDDYRIVTCDSPEWHLLYDHHR